MTIADIAAEVVAEQEHAADVAEALEAKRALHRQRAVLNAADSRRHFEQTPAQKAMRRESKRRRNSLSEMQRRFSKDLWLSAQEYYGGLKFGDLPEVVTLRRQVRHSKAPEARLIAVELVVTMACVKPYIKGYCDTRRVGMHSRGLQLAYTFDAIMCTTR